MASQEQMIRFKPGPKLVKVIKSEIKETDNETKIPNSLLEFLACENSDKASITLPDLEWLKARLSVKGLFLCQHLQDCDLILPTPPVQPRNPELEARCQRLRKEQDDREYRAMTKMVDPKRYKEPEESIAFQLKQINRQLIGVAQFVFSVAAGFAFGFLGLELIIGGLEMGFRILCGIFCSVVIAVAEIYFLIGHLNAEDVIPSEVEREKNTSSSSVSIVKQHQD